MRFQFIKILLVFGVVVIFAKVYQHNLYVRTLYALQYIQHERVLLKKKKRLLLVSASKQSSAESLYKWATSSLGMKPLPLDKVITITGVCYGA